MTIEIYKQVNELIAPLLDEFGVELVELTIKYQNQAYNVDVFADKPQGGITLDICAKLNLKISALLEEKDIFDLPYIVGVSSPGLDRPLKSIKDFLRVKGKKVRFYLSERINNKLEHVGTILGANELEIIINQNDEVLNIPLEKINKAIQEI
ncbi:MAG: ribosome maturation factor RimP [Candidatus Omnitrophica bacterium]|nr:ribosome maturation factor RimP [Candidatus Omnitrophota bacterium]